MIIFIIRHRYSNDYKKAVCIYFIIMIYFKVEKRSPFLSKCNVHVENKY